MERFLCTCSICVGEYPDEGGNYVSKSTRWKHKKRDRKWEYNLRDYNNDEDIEDL